MNERNLSRRLSASVVDALKAHGHILVVKGGATALARELDELMAPEIATIEPRLQPHSPLVGEPTSTFGDEAVDQAVEDMVLKLTHALMNSDHVEDVFAEDAVIRRDIFRVVRDGLREPHLGEPGDDSSDQASVTVKLDALGYVAATASRLTDASTLRQALDRAASVAGAHFLGFSPELREATFRLEGNGVDERLEIEEAVADELTDLIEQGLVDLPTEERRLDLGRALPASEQRALRSRIEAAAQATLVRTGCPFAWELADARTLRVLFTPLSEQDLAGIDAPTGAFAREVALLLNGSAATALRASRPAAPKPLVRVEELAVEPLPAPTSSRKPAIAIVTPEPAPSSKPPSREKSPVSRRAVAAAPSTEPEVPAAKAAPKATAKRAATSKKRAAAAVEAPAEPAPKPSARKSAAGAKATAKTAASKRAATASGKAAKAPAKKR